MGPIIETEMWEPGTVLMNKINKNHTYLATMSYWPPLQDTEDDATVRQINIATSMPQSITNTTSNTMDMLNRMPKSNEISH